jgi:hypothetical protein
VVRVTRLQYAVSQPRVTRRADGVLFYEVPHVVTAATTKQFYDDLRTMPRGMPNKIIVDARGMGMIDAEARRTVYTRSMEAHDVDVVVVTATRLQWAVIRFLILATHRPNVHCVKSIKEADAWAGA